MIHRSQYFAGLLLLVFVSGLVDFAQSVSGQEVQELPEDPATPAVTKPSAPPNAPGQPGGDGRSRGDRGRSERGGPGRRDAMPPAAPGNQPGGKNAKSKVRVGRVGPKANIPPATLPAQYALRDTNKDGQIGMYEWPRTDLATFNRLDTNHDGFLVPSELASPGTSSSGSTTVASSTVGNRGSMVAARPTSGGTSTGLASTTTPAAPPPPVIPAGDLKTVAAESAFDFLDKDKDGVLSAEELDRSRNAKKLFADAKLEIQFPFSKQKFVENYVRLSN